MFSASLLFSASGAKLCRAQEFFPLQDVRPGMHGIGRTVFSGEKIDEFQVEILGILPNLGPKGPVILARLSGGPLAETGILQGMSGSPVYLAGKLLGAVALGFPFSKEPIAGIQPIEAMISGSSVGMEKSSSQPGFMSEQFGTWTLARLFHATTTDVLPAPVQSSLPFGELESLLTPLSFSGFTTASVQTFATTFRPLGFESAQGFTSSEVQIRTPSPGLHSTASAVVPGSMISVGLLTGDMNITADGTVTYVNGNRVYAFGHRFLDIGSTELPFAHSQVVGLIPNLNSSFKLSAPQTWEGSILSDRASAISGEIGRSAHTVPLNITVHSTRTGTHEYHFQVVNDRFLTPFITQTALFSVLDATERTIGSGTLQLNGTINWKDARPPLVVRDTFISDSGLVQQVALDAVVPLGFVLSGGFQDLRMAEINFTLDASESKRQLHLAQAWTSAHEVHPGDSLQVHVLLEGENGLQTSRSVAYAIPAGASAGSLNLTVSDANTLNFPEFAGLTQSSAQNAAALINTINSFRDSDALYIRVWRQQPSFIVAGPTRSGELSDPPPSVALILSNPSSSAVSSAGQALTRGSGIAELSIRTPGYVVTGAKTLQVDVKE